MVIVHSVSSVAWLRNLSFPVLDRMDNNLLKLHIYPLRERAGYSFSSL